MEPLWQQTRCHSMLAALSLAAKAVFPSLATGTRDDAVEDIANMPREKVVQGCQQAQKLLTQKQKALASALDIHRYPPD